MSRFRQTTKTAAKRCLNLIFLTAIFLLSKESGAAAADGIFAYKDGGVVVLSNIGRKAELELYESSTTPDGVIQITIRPGAIRPGKRSPRPKRVPKEYAKLIEEACALHDFSPAMATAVMAVESAFNPLAVSSAGAQGLMQLMPATAEQFGVQDPFDPKENIFGGVRYLKFLLDLFDGDMTKTIAAYNAGPIAVTKANGIPNFSETRSYVSRVMEYFEYYNKAPPKDEQRQRR